MKKWFFINMLMLIASICFSGCKKEELNSLSISVDKINLNENGGVESFTITTNAAQWSISNSGSNWIKLSRTLGDNQTGLVTISVTSKTIAYRTDTLTIRAGNAKPCYILVSQKSSEFIYGIASNIKNIEFVRSGNQSSVTIATDAPKWQIASDANWITFSKTNGTTTNETINVTAAENTASDVRTAVITLKADYAPSVTITVSQKGELYPNYNTNPIAADILGMESNAVELASKIKIGWNLGNSLEAIGGETAWGNPMATQAFINLVKQSGFNAIRIPCAWNAGHLSNPEKAEINTQWLARVKEVVMYCTNNDMYAIINIHWDGGWLENNCNPSKQDDNNAKQKAFWQQIATHFRDFDEHLLFAGANEPNVDDATQMAVLNSYSQTFIDAVRSTGGKNAYRTLIIQGPSTDIAKTNSLMIMPTDKTPNRLMVEVHYYTPWNFCGMTKDETWGKMFYYWGKQNHVSTEPDRNASYGEETDVDKNFRLMKTKFVDNGIPVVLGEFSATRRTELTGTSLEKHLASRAYFNKYIVKQAKANGLIPFYWDNGGIDNHACGIFNRKNNTIFDQLSLDGLMDGLK
jgi:endoglucanase